MNLTTTILGLLRADYGAAAIELAHDLEWLRGVKGATEDQIAASLVDLRESGLAVEAEDGWRRVVKVEARLF